MKNLKLCSELTVELNLQSEDELILFSAADVEQNRLFFASTSNIIYVLHLHSSQERKRNKNFLAVEDEYTVPILEPGDAITALDYLMEREALIVGTSNGYLLLHSLDGNITEVVGRVDGGVKSISPSPDGALLVVAAGFGQLLVMTHDWEVLYESMLDPPEICNDMPSVDTTSSISSSYLLESPISWRGDGKYFATLTRGGNSCSLWQLKIWERESGALYSSSESKSFTGAVLDWMPSGAKVAAVYDRKSEEKCPAIVLFEKNGLERSSFSTDEPMEVTVEQLKWNCNSELLAAVVRHEWHDAIKIWSYSNNHWYMKQEMRYPSKEKVKIMWDPVKPLRLICWTSGAKITTYDFVWMTSVMDNSISLVIDNTTILVSPLAQSLMPPPLSLFKLKFLSSVQEIAFFCKNSKTHLAVRLADGNLSVAELPAVDTWDSLEGNELSIETCHSDSNFGSIRHVTWLDSHLLLGVLHCESSCTEFCSPLLFQENGPFQENGFSHQQGKGKTYGYILQEIEVVCSEDSVPDLVTSGRNAKISKNYFSERTIIAVAPNPNKKYSFFVQFDGGSVVECSSKLSTLMQSPELYLQELDQDIRFSSSCPWMHVVPVCDSGLMKSLVFGLDDNGRLHVGRRILCNNCSSFSFYSNVAAMSQQVVTHVILTTKQDLLFILSIYDILHGNQEIISENPNLGRIKNNGKENSDGLKIWERGAKLIGVINGDEAAVILQTARGSLECIYPRKLVLVSIVDALVRGRFKDAMLMVRRHRIDLNVIVDHCGWLNFLQTAGEFVHQVNNLTHITEFVCSIKNENVMETLYKNVIVSTCQKDHNTIQFEAKNKVSSVLMAIRKALEEFVPKSSARELCILTTLVRSSPPDLEEALKRVKKIREMELSGIGERESYPSADEAVKHLLWLSDPEAVYEAALGLYDLNLSAIVALNSQKDPKEFLPFLQQLEHLAPSVMKYTIDLKLQRFESALRHLASAGEPYYDDCLSLVKSNPQLFPLALQLFTGLAKRNQIFEAWGDHFHGAKCFEDAATTYLCCSSFEKALRSYRAGGHWKGVLTVAGLLKLGKEEVLQLANELCEELQALGKPAEAAKISLEYCEDVHGGIRYLVTAREWDEALRVGFMHGREDLISEVKNAAMECASTLVSEYEEGLEKVGKYLARYLAVRQRRLALAAKLQMEDRSVIDGDDDTASETSSNFSGMSAYNMGRGKGSSSSISSSTVSKTRELKRRHRGGKIRAGSPGEEMALVEHLRGMSLSSGAEHELKSLILALVMLGKEETARKVQRAGDNFQVSQRAAVKLTEDRMNSDNLDESSYSLEHYVQKVRGETPYSETLSWQYKPLLSL